MKNFEIKNLFWKFFKKLANLNLSISILFLIALFCIVGSIIEQDQSNLYYQINYPEFNSTIVNFNWKWIVYLGLDHMFRTSWFIFTLLIFISSLFACTLSTQLPSLKNARRWKFINNKTYNDEKNYFVNNRIDSSNSFINIIYSLMRSNFFVFCQSNALYAYKGLYGRIAPIFVHFSIITILLGSTFSFLSSFTVQEMVPNGEIFHLKNVVQAGFYSKLPLDIFGYIDNFYIDYNLNGSIKQFFSFVSLFNQNKFIGSSKLISVNTPLRFHHIAIYQTDWQINALRIHFSSYSIQKKLIKTTIGNRSCWLCSFPINNQKQIFIVIFNLDNTILLCDSNGFILNKLSIGQSFYIDNIPCIIENIISSTGLQIKMDPGIILVYFGFFFLMLSSLISYLSYSQMWVCHLSGYLHIFGCTNRATLFFEEDVLYMNDIYFYYLSYRIINIYIFNLVLR
uniref:Cytochrome c biogenesis protein Ccs1 n=1 Tax=Thaumatella adunca TaxID=2006976 RepID=A0A1Z1MMQ8_9FLOR|nr:cytochrome c biogenesis protein ccs1 [Thaumatella adunca]ARW67367.1 cytochrome c biogenesis protein ccs1 [Thaumatella adunca]